MACCDIRFTLDFTTECFREEAKHYIVVNFVHQETRRRDYFQTDGVTTLSGVDFMVIRVRKPNTASYKLSDFSISKVITNYSPVAGVIKRIPANYYTEMPNKLRFEVVPNCYLSTSQLSLADALFVTPDYTETASDGTVIEYRFFVDFLDALVAGSPLLSPRISIIDMPIVTSSDIPTMVAEIQKLHGSNVAEVSSSSFEYKPMQYVLSTSGICRCLTTNVSISFPHNVPDGTSLSLCTNDINSLNGFRLVEGPYNYSSFSNTRRKSCSDCSRFGLLGFQIPSLNNVTAYYEMLYLFFQPCADVVVSLSSTFQSTTGVKVQKVESSITDMLPLPYSETYKAYRPVSLRFVPVTAVGTATSSFMLDTVFQGTYVPFLLGSMAIWIVRIDNATNSITYIPYSGTINYMYDPIAAAPYANVLTPNGL